MTFTNDRPIHRKKYLCQVSVHFNWSMVGQYGVIFIGTMKKLPRFCFSDRVAQLLTIDRNYNNDLLLLFFIIEILAIFVT